MVEKTQTSQSLTLERTYKQSPEKVWAAWTNAQALKAWFFPADVPSVKIAKLDLKPGGEYRIEFAAGKMGAHTAVGKFREIVPSQRLVLTWNWEGQPAMDSVVTIDLKKTATGTHLTLRHDGLPAPEAVMMHKEGWNGILDRSVKHIG